MLVRDRKDVARSARMGAGRDVKAAAQDTKSRLAGAGWSSAGGRGFTRPEIGQDRLTVVSLFIVAVLSALNVMLRFPDLGALIASVNQF